MSLQNDVRGRGQLVKVDWGNRSVQAVSDNNSAAKWSMLNPLRNITAAIRQLSTCCAGRTLA
jgi:hypothetical protein